MPAAVRSHFFEFLDDGGQVRLLHELAPGVEYGVVVTTGGGLYRYRLQDRVRVTGLVQRTPAIRFVGKEDQISDLCGEKLSAGFVAQSLSQVFEAFGLRPQFVLLAPDEPPGYTLYLEVGNPVMPEGLADAMETALQHNPHYRLGIQLGQLARVRIFEIEGAAAPLYLERQRQRGQRLGNIKPEVLSREGGWSKVFQGRYI